MRKVTMTCDRCGKEYSPYVSSHGNQGFQFFRHLKKNEIKPDGRKMQFSDRKDLCPTCMEELEGWYFDEDVDVSPEVNEELEMETPTEIEIE